MGKLRIGALGLLAAAAPAQEGKWQLPALGAVEYRRQWRAGSSVSESAAAARAQPARGPVPEKYLPRLLPAPWLCQGELQPDQRSVATPVRDLRDLVRSVALDLGARSWRFARVPPFGDLAVTGRVGPLQASGAQELVLTIARRAPAAQPGETEKQRADIAALCAVDAAGTLTIRRTVDSARGLVGGFQADLALIADEGKKAHRRIDLHDSWQLVDVRDNQDADFRLRVAAAVRAGAAWIRGAIDGGDASFLQDGGDDDRSYGSGRLALAALTLLHADVPHDDSVLAAAFAALRRRKFVDTYSLGTALMAMSQRYAPPREAELVRSGALQGRAARQLDDRDRKLAARWLERLLENRDTRVDAAATLRFDYDGGKRYDNSLSQYALLGLDAAALCGLEVADATWMAAARHFLDVQCPAQGAALELQLTTHAELARAAGAPPPQHPVRALPRGFAYQGREQAPYGSMTAASVAGLVVARAGALRTGAATAAELRAVDDAIHAGFAWMAGEFTVRSNPGHVGKSDAHWYYWLYSLERACELAGVARLQGRDWYYEGALQLLAQQQQNGSFRADRGDTLLLESTCFAVLFLKKATLAVITGR